MNIFFFLVLHIIGLATMAGTTIVSYVCYGQFWKQYALGKQGAMAILNVTASFRFLFAGGFLLLLISGIGMVVLSHGLFAQQWWFRIKMGLLVLILLNGAVYGQRLTSKLRQAMELQLAGGNALDSLESLKSSILVMHLGQLLLFAGIFVLSIYKFN
ncbi:hypothetical protein Q4E93_24720 [Flavitalea sp. BT771]|uniref:hypothetical protein n=1 Tax=Flavitalea sp. BT771 TaxID=3063329 RepID=UPI0026E24CF8|nr:hypothetical protein [Flavitalea sp. BT771]MDO6433833.1 hypothetical protein [Flavitalea sp. BT771]MDV6222262.1 hypothetical protein [Flavitalea sp. BT771]